MNQKMVFSTERKKRNQEFYVNLKLDKEESKNELNGGLKSVNKENKNNEDKSVDDYMKDNIIELLGDNGGSIYVG